MRLLLFFLPLLCAGQQLSVTVPLSPHFIKRVATGHPRVAFHEFSTDTINGAASSFALQSGNYVDWRTTTIAFTGANAGKYCENNPLLKGPNGCAINLPKFDGVKLGVALADVASWLPIAFHLANPHGTYAKIATISRYGMAVVFVPVDASNIHQLLK